MASRSVFVLATVLSVQEKFAYTCCTRCRKRVRTQDQKFSCSSCKRCYEGDDVHYRYRISLVVSDRSQVANVTVFGSCLDVFFGASATEFMRFLGRKQSDPDNQTIELNRLVHQAVQQCFVGSMLKFGFRLSPPCRMESQILRCSPVNLENVVSQQQMQNESQYRAKLEGKQHSMPSVLANIVVPCLSTEYQTVLGILQGYLERLCTTASSTPSSPDVMSVPTADCYEGPGGKLSHGDGSAIHCSAATGLSMLTSPLVLTCDSASPTQDVSNSDSFSIPCAAGTCSKPEVEEDDIRNTDVVMLKSSEKDCFEDFSPWYLVSQEPEYITRSPRVSQALMTKPSSAVVSLTRNKPCDYLDSQHTDASQLCPEIKWSQLEDLPSSEDLSAFLADLAVDGDFTGDEAPLQVVLPCEQNTAASDRHNEWESFEEPNTASNRHDKCGSFDESTVAVDKLQNCTEPRDLGRLDGYLTPDAEEELAVNEEDTASDCHCEIRSFNQPIEAVDKLHNVSELTDLVLCDSDSCTGGAAERLVAITNEEASCDSLSGCHTEMRSYNDHKLQNYAQLTDLALDGDLTDDEERVVVANQEAATSSGCHNEMDIFDEPIEAVDKLQNFAEPTDLLSSEDLEAFLADMDEDCFVEDTCPAFHSTILQAATLTSNSPNYLKSSAPEKTSFIYNKLRKGDDGCENVPLRGANTRLTASCRPWHGSDIIRTDDYAKEGHDGVGSRLSAENHHQGSTPDNSCSTPSVSCDTPLRVAMDMNKACRATKRAPGTGDKLTPNNLRVALLRKLTESGEYSVSSPTDLSPLMKIRRKGEQCHDLVDETPEQMIDFGEHSEELFSGVEDCSHASADVCDLCSQNHSIMRSTDFIDVFTCEESAGVQEPSILDSSCVCSTSGKYGVMRKRCAQEVDKSVTEDKEQHSCLICSVTSKDSSKSDSPSCLGSPELFSSSSSPSEGSPNLFSPSVNSDEYSSSCEASGSVFLFSSQGSQSSCLSPDFCPESFSDIHEISHSTPLLNSARREANAASANQRLIQSRQRALCRSTTGVTPQSMELI